MDLSEDVRSTLFDAAARALRFNAPLGDDRAIELVETIQRTGPGRIVDLGCGRGGLARLVAARLENAAVIGVDTDALAIEDARRLATESGFGGRIRFEVGDASTWFEAVDVAICVGASHAFAGPTAMFTRLAELVSTGIAVVGDGVWEADPNPWCLTELGDHPVGVEGLVALAEAVGWTVRSAELSTPAEWDDFETRWVDGVRSVGTPSAHTFAVSRERDYRDHYRGVLGFCWLVLTR